MTATATPDNSPPVEDGVWVFVFGELSMFTLLFATFLYYRAGSPEVYEASQATLLHGMGALNTLLLLASSYFVASATAAMCLQDEGGLALRRMHAALFCGVAFVLVKAIEYAHAFQGGYDVLSNGFFMFYFTLTGIHLMHVLVGLGLLRMLLLQMRNRCAGAGDVSPALLGFSTSFWHMVDIVWIVLFPLLYLLS